MNDTIEGVRVSGQRHARRAGHLRPGRRPRARAPPRRHGLPALRTRSRSRSSRTSPTASASRAVADRDADRRARRARAPAGGALGRGEGSPRRVRPRALGRAAAAPLHRARARGRAGGAPDGRAGERARPDRDRRRSRISISELRASLTIVIVTHNMQQAARVSQQHRRSSTWAVSSRSARRRPSSPVPRSARPRTTSPAGSAEAPRRRHHVDSSVQCVGPSLSLSWRSVSRSLGCTRTDDGSAGAPSSDDGAAPGSRQASDHRQGLRHDGHPRPALGRDVHEGATRASTIQVTGGGSGTGIAALINGTTDICESSRPMKDKEKARRPGEARRARGRDQGRPRRARRLREREEPAAGDLDPGARTRSTWARRRTGRTSAARTTRSSSTVARTTRGTYGYFKEHVLENKDFAAATQTLAGTSAVVNAVKGDEFGIGYGGIAYLEGIRALKVKKDDASPAGRAVARDGAETAPTPSAASSTSTRRARPTGDDEEVHRLGDWPGGPEGHLRRRLLPASEDLRRHGGERVHARPSIEQRAQAVSLTRRPRWTERVGRGAGQGGGARLDRVGPPHPRLRRQGGAPGPHEPRGPPEVTFGALFAPHREPATCGSP